MSVPVSVRYSLLDMIEDVSDNPKIITNLQKWKAVPEEPHYLCAKCGGSYSLAKNERSREGYMWECKNTVIKGKKRVRCGRRVSLRMGTFFENSRLAIWQILTFVYLWVRNSPLCLISETAKISDRRATDWASFCREVVFHSFVDTQTPLGGEGVVVEIEESEFGKTKYGRGRPIIGHWIFGGLERGTGRVFLVPVEDRSANTLIPLINNWILPGTTIMSNCWKTYQLLKSTAEHFTVNPQTGAHTSAIEETSRAARYTVGEPGRRMKRIPGNLAKYMFQKRCRTMTLEPFKEFLRMAGQLYNPLNPPQERLRPMDEGEEVRLEEDEVIEEEDSDEEDEEEGTVKTKG